jgi:hypothetical protein
LILFSELNLMNKILIILFLISSSIIHAAIDTDEYVIYPGYEINDHVSKVNTRLKSDNLSYTKGGFHPGRNLADSNLYATLFVQLPEKNVNHIKAPQMDLTFYRNRLLYISYKKTFTTKSDAISAIYSYHKSLGPVSDSSNLVSYSESIHDYISLFRYSMRYTWKGKKYDIVCVYGEAKPNGHEVELIKVDLSTYRKYRSELSIINEQWNEAKLKEKKNENKTFIDYDLLAPLSDIVLNVLSISALEKLLPSYLRSGFTFYEGKKEADGIYWGINDIKKKKYFVYTYSFLSSDKYSKEKFCLIRQLLAYTDLKNNVFGLKVYFGNYAGPKLPQLEKILKDKGLKKINTEQLQQYADPTGKIYIEFDPSGGSIQEIIIMQKDAQFYIRQYK